jgi:hypothetical protein
MIFFFLISFNQLLKKFLASIEPESSLLCSLIPVIEPFAKLGESHLSPHPVSLGPFSNVFPLYV